MVNVHKLTADSCVSYEDITNQLFWKVYLQLDLENFKWKYTWHFEATQRENLYAYKATRPYFYKQVPVVKQYCNINVDSQLTYFAYHDEA